MNLLFYFENIITPTKGGTERVAWLVSRWLSEQGHDVYYLADGREDDSLMSENKFSLPKEGEIAAKASFVDGLCQKLNIDVIVNEGGNTDDVYLFSHQILQTSAKIITCIHFDITADTKRFYSTYNYRMKNLSWRTRLHKLSQIARLPYLKYFNTNNKRKRYRYTCAHSDRVLVLSPEGIKDFYTFTQSRDEGKVVFLPNPNTFSLREINFQAVRKQKIALFVGRLEFSPKKIHRILKIWKTVHDTYPEWTLNIVGDGPDRSRLEHLVRKWKLHNVKFIGLVQDVAPYYIEARILFLTSDYEGTPMVIPEAMSYGVIPIVYHSFSGAQLHIEPDVTGYLVPAFNQHLFEKTVLKVMNQEPMDEDTYSRVRQRLNHFEIDQVGTQWLFLLEQLFDKKSCRHS